MTGPDEFAKVYNVSRETLDRLNTYHQLLHKWNPSINPVSRSTLADAWARHFADSAQLWSLSPETATLWADFGSGGGFPGMVIAIFAAEKRPAMEVVLVESDGRKAAFLSAVARETGITPRILTDRVETLQALQADVVSARALASLDVLLGYAARHLVPGGMALFPKGEKAQAELDNARATWRFSLQEHRSQTDPSAAILQIEGLCRV